MSMTRMICVLLVMLLWAAVPSRAEAQVRHAADLTTVEFAALDRARTAVIVPGGILEEHGPYLPSGSDTHQARWLADALARRVAARSGWQALLLPVIPLGHSGANDIARQWVYPGTITIRTATLRAVYMDLADSLGEHGFKYVFLVHVHGAPLHNQMLEQASDYFQEVWGGRMVHLMGLKAVNDHENDPLALAPEASRKADGFTVHAGLSESSRVLFTRPDLVKPGLFAAPALTADDFGALVSLSKTKAWQGYWGAPAASTVTLGAALLENTAARIGAIVDAVLDGTPWPVERFFTESAMDPADRAISRDAEQRERQLLARQQAWLKKHGLE
jgi:creatinine amidohydrolase/Fe(II)-dependent formamide hydrolase-like protein